MPTTSSIKALVSEDPSGILPEEDWGKWIPRIEGTRRLRLPVMPEMRSVICYNCERETAVPAKALSALCSLCRSHLMLTNVVLRQGSARPNVSTIGNISIAKGANLSGLKLNCNNLHVQGTIDGQLRCRAKLTMSHDNKLTKKPQVGTLLVERGVTLKLPAGIDAEEIIIKGELHGDITATHSIKLESGGSLHGDCHTPSLEIAALTAVHHGRWQQT